MRMLFFVTGLTCQECADKLEAHIQKMPGVNGAALMVNGRFIIDCDEDRAEEIANEVLTSAPKAQGEVVAKRIQ
ncbi:MAG: heavy-metal-associated domain-containing protein [Thermoplasmata archaeon]|jgi:copper chaperone CopZ|nr:heavy-metal-associated domain-containing protein [Thermoplasmata archaeon]MBO5547662.1 heavy-metal-associated domain-containing protein [Candidatus Methanomethylophilaceae archaeon]MBR4685701.1 heavy-metal-associated domain-containing protein [Candidatus Methanomethylophilaceae archaeon]